MKICVLRRDGENVHNGMAEIILMLVHKYFGEDTKVYVQSKSEEQFTQMVAFDVSSDEESSNIIEFIVDISAINPLYAVKIFWLLKFQSCICSNSMIYYLHNFAKIIE